jgi:AcrR family transcriptional regulator
MNTPVHSFRPKEDSNVNIGDQVSSPKVKAPRGYQLRARADKQAETHRTLAQAAYELHRSVGPANATVSAIAERAGVQRLTVYRHFPDMDAIFAACTAHAFEKDPPPNPETWQAIPAPETRLRVALGELYAYHRRNHQLLANLYRDAHIAAVAAGLARRAAMLARGAAVLEIGWTTAGVKATHLTAAVLAHALDFGAWQSLTRQLSDAEAIDVMVQLVKSVATPASKSGATP